MTQTAVADALSGSNKPDLLSAVETWLNDNDKDSLPALASLARKGNTAARLLLARIEFTDRAVRKYVSDLSRTERLNLFRANIDNSAFRSSWIKVESDNGHPVAQALFEAASLGINVPGIRRLQQIGEFEATEYLIKKVAVDGSQSERQELIGILPAESELVPYLRAFLYNRQGMTTAKTALQHIIGAIENTDPESVNPGNDADTQDAATFVDIGYQADKHRIHFTPDNKHYDTVARWILTSPNTASIANLCHRICDTSEIPACAVTGLGLVGGYYEAIRFDSPIETLISQERFINSERALGMTLRKIAFFRTEAGDAVFSEQEFREKSRCLAEAAVR